MVDTIVFEAFSDTVATKADVAEVKVEIAQGDAKGIVEMANLAKAEMTFANAVDSGR